MSAGMDAFIAWPPPQEGRCPLCEEPIKSTEAVESLVAGDVGWRAPRSSKELDRAFKVHHLCADALRRERQRVQHMAGP